VLDKWKWDWHVERLRRATAIIADEGERSIDAIAQAIKDAAASSRALARHVEDAGVVWG